MLLLHGAAAAPQIPTPERPKGKWPLEPPPERGLGWAGSGPPPAALAHGPHFRTRATR